MQPAFPALWGTLDGEDDGDDGDGGSDGGDDDVGEYGDVIVVVLVVIMVMVVMVMIMVVMIVLVLLLLLVVMMMMMVVVVVMMLVTVGDDAIDGDVFGDDDGDSGWGALNWGTCKCLVVWVHVLLFLPNSFKSLLNSPKYIFFNTGSAPLLILCQIIYNRFVARIALQPQHSVNFDTYPLG